MFIVSIFPLYRVEGALRTNSVERATVNLYVYANKTEIFSYKRDILASNRNL